MSDGAGFAFIDGSYVPFGEAKISIFDAGFTRGDAVYDTVSVWKGLLATRPQVGAGCRGEGET